MPKKSTPDSELAAEFKALKALAKEKSTLLASLAKVTAKQRKTVHALHTKQGANIESMAAIFGVSRQALAKDIRTIDLANGAKPRKKVAAAAKPAKRVVRKTVA